ncbi:N-6 DNA methylase [uncultured Adlercreutzia sp.]|uniref:N-6 DNA methylase n=1 Tax=uncultured Adlercreutzia sp. TaxID=875803 RepID=UPI0026F37DF9|nr:N-6 DNA methylase [uncultured Adlercreutzia sp.]
MRQDDTEATIASVFETEIYHFVKVEFGKELKFEKEVGASYFRHTFSGRIDAVVDGLVIEYKRPKKFSTDADRAIALDQITNYLQQLWRETGAKRDGVLTDGQRVQFVYWFGDAVRATGLSIIGVSSVDKMVRSFIESDAKAFSAENILADFSLKGKKTPTFELSQALFKIVTSCPTEKTQMLYSEWLSLFHLSEADSGKNSDIVKRRRALGEFFHADMENNDVDYKALFVLQSTYAIVVKLIACKAIHRLAYSEEVEYFDDLAAVDSLVLRDFLAQLEDGYVYAAGGIRNLLEGDFFSWYSDEDQWCVGLFEPIKTIISQIALYSNAMSTRSSTLDIFKDLYMDFIPQEVRHSLGEYYTPTWLAEHVVKMAVAQKGIPSKWVGVDPCCGSGVFLLAMINEISSGVDTDSLSEFEKREMLQDILERVSGVDINPLSVLTARVNYFLAIKPLIADGSEIEIPVYVGDSAVIPSREVIDGVDCLTYTVGTSKKAICVSLPMSFVQASTFLEKMNELQTAVKAENSQVLSGILRNAIGGLDGRPNLLRKIDEFAETLVDLHKERWDGIWVRIVSNFMLSSRSSNADLIVGNPPWVKWEYLPTAYAEKLKRVCFDRHMFSGQSYMGAISLNVCAAIANMTASMWLKKGGVQALLMPKNLLTQDSYEGFRRFLTPDSSAGSQMFLQYVEDWSKIPKLFGKATEPCCTFLYGFDPVPYSKGVPIVRYEKKQRADFPESSHWSDVCKLLNEKRGIAIQLDGRRTGFSLFFDSDVSMPEKFKSIIGESSYRARTGVEFVPNEVTLVEQVGSGRSDKTWRFKNVRLAASMHKARESRSIELERCLIRPVLEAPKIKDFHIEQIERYCIFPYEGKETLCCSLARLSEIAPKTMNYLLRHKDLFSRQSERSKAITRGDEFYALSKIGPYTYGEHMVVFRDNTRLSAAVLEPVTMPWGSRVMPIPAKHAALVSTRADGTPIVEDEAYYLAGILNTPVVQKYYSATYSGRSYSIKFNIKLPLFDPKNSTHRRICSLSRKAHSLSGREEAMECISEEIERLYMGLCEEGDDVICDSM